MKTISTVAAALIGVHWDDIPKVMQNYTYSYRVLAFGDKPTLAAGSVRPGGCIDLKLDANDTVVDAYVGR